MSKFDAIIILGYGPVKEKPNSILKSRLDLGIQLYEKKLAPRLIMSGGFTNKKFDISEAEGMKRYAIQQDVNPKDIVKEEESGDTLTEFFHLKKKLLEPKRWKRLIIVTSDFHMRRTKLIARKILGPKYKLIFRSSSAFTLKQFLFNLIDHENDMYELTESILKNVEPSNDEQIQEILNYHPFYSNNPKLLSMSYEEVKKLMQKFGISNKFLIKYGWYIRRRLKNFKKENNSHV